MTRIMELWKLKRCAIRDLFEEWDELPEDDDTEDEDDFDDTDDTEDDMMPSDQED